MTFVFYLISVVPTTTTTPAPTKPQTTASTTSKGIKIVRSLLLEIEEIMRDTRNDEY